MPSLACPPTMKAIVRKNVPRGIRNLDIGSTLPCRGVSYLPNTPGGQLCKVKFRLAQQPRIIADKELDKSATMGACVYAWEETAETSWLILAGSLWNNSPWLVYSPRLSIDGRLEAAWRILKCRFKQPALLCAPRAKRCSDPSGLHVTSVASCS